MAPFLFLLPYYNIMFDALSDYKLFNTGEVIERDLTTNSTSNTNGSNIADMRYSKYPQNQLTDIKDGNQIIEKLEERLEGRYALEDIKHPETGEVIVAKNEMITDKLADKVVASGVTKAKIRTILFFYTQKKSEGVFCRKIGQVASNFV